MMSMIISPHQLGLPTFEVPVLLEQHAFLRIKGPDRFDFLQGLMTQDVFLLNTQLSLYTLFLNPKGRFLWDAFLWQDGDSFLMEIPHRGLELFAYLNRYKLRRNVTIQEENDFCTLITPHHHTINDSYLTSFDARLPDVWMRHIIKKENLPPHSYTTDCNPYHFFRIAHGLAEGKDFIVEKSFPMEVGLQNFHALHFKKGCYIGQEPIARAHYQGVIRKKLCPIVYTDDAKSDACIVAIYSTSTYNGITLALAMIRMESTEIS